jgi:hypothetical protein
MMSRTLRELKDLNRVARNNTALVLSDEHLLSQVMHSIPEDYADINITMGYPLIHTPAFSLVQALVDLQMRRKDSDGQPLYYFQDVLRILEHQYFSGMEDAELHDRIHQIKSGNQIFPSQSFLSVNEMTGTLFRPVATAPEMIEYLRDILLGALPEDQGQQEDADPRKDLQKEFIYHLYLTVNRLGDLMQRTMPDMGLDVLLRLLKKMLRGVTIPFLGEPLRGLQVMGILETRVLDFENLVILSMNEGIFPKAAPGMTMIPYNLRKGFGLPTPEHQDRLFAYYFYRLMHHAQNITFIYNSRADGLRTGEMSRFLYQLKYLYGWPISFQSLATSIRHIPDRIIEVAKGVEEMGLLNAYTERGEAILTPSALNHYLDCSLRFYFRYLAGLKEPEEVSEEPDQAVFGNLLHYTMEKLLSDAPDGTVTEPFIQELLTSGSRVRASIEEAMTRIWPEEKGPTSSGRFYIIREILFRYIGQVLKHDLQWVPFKILGLEQRITMPYEIKGPSDTLHIKLGGIIDRIDRVGNAIRIIDYKTGSVEKSIGTIDALFTRGSQNRRREGFQTFVYSWMVSVNRAHNEAVKPGLYDVRNMNSDQFRPEFTMQRKPILDLRPYFSDIEVALVDLLKEIFNPDLPFAQVADRKVCEWCPYQRICKRD